MCKYRIGACAILISVALCGCARPMDEIALTQWGTACADYGLSPKECHAEFTSYRAYMAQGTESSHN
jgi:hypothetical protein